MGTSNFKGFVVVPGTVKAMASTQARSTALDLAGGESSAVTVEDDVGRLHGSD